MTTLPDRDKPRFDPGRMTALLPILFLATSPLVFWLFTGSLGAALGAVFLMGLIATGLSLIASGARIEALYRAARTARRPLVPRKLCGAAVLGLTALLLAASQFTTWMMPLAFGFAGFALSVLAFGIDPMRDKGFDDPDLLARHAVERTVAASDTSLTALVERVAQLDEPELTLRMEAVRSAILRLVRAHASCPESFSSFEKPLTTFISIADGEVSALERGWSEDSHRAAQRFSARIAALTDGFEARARKRRARRDADMFAFDADLILERVRQNKAA